MGPLTNNQQQLVTTLEVIRVEEHLPYLWKGFPGRPLKDRAAIARAFVAKAIYGMATTRMLLDRLATDAALRRICGWEKKRDVPSESVFSRAFAEFAANHLTERVHEALIKSTLHDRLVGHLSRDGTAIEAREKPVQKPEQPPQPPKKRGRPKHGEEPVRRPPTRLERQQTMTLEEMCADLPTACNVGTKRNSQGHQESWIGYKLHRDTADGDIPISCLLSSASMHDSQAAIPLATLSAQRVISLYDLMDAAYDAPEIKAHSRSLGHVPLIDTNPRRNAALKGELQGEARRRALIHLPSAEDVRYHERSAAERVNGRLKDEFGGRYVRVRGHAKVTCHLMFGILALTANQLMRLIT
ncbi:MAG: transposase [Dehalococcoidia bacterium]|nr:transposase [Dehalococcoidia bacterium]